MRSPRDVEAGRPVALATVIEHPDPARLGRRGIRPDAIVRHEKLHPEAKSGADRHGLSGSLGSKRADDAVRDDALGLLAAGHNATLTYGPDGERRGEGMRVFVWAFAPKPRMLVFGAIDFAAAVARVGSFLGYHVTVCDARPVFATASRFPEADEVVVDWPHRYLEAEMEAGRVDGARWSPPPTHDPKEFLRPAPTSVRWAAGTTPATTAGPLPPAGLAPDPEEMASFEPRSAWPGRPAIAHRGTDHHSGPPRASTGAREPGPCVRTSGPSTRPHHRVDPTTTAYYRGATPPGHPGRTCTLP